MIVTAVVLVIALAMMAVERMRPGRAWPSVRTWWLRAIALNLVQVVRIEIMTTFYKHPVEQLVNGILARPHAALARAGVRSS